MKTSCVWVSLLMAVAVTGCRDAEKAGTQSVSVSLFKQGKGLFFSEETKKLLGIEVAEVTERPMQHRIEKSAQVYRTESGGGPSSAVLLLEADEAAALTAGKLVQIRAVKGQKPALAGKLAQLDRRAIAALGQAEGIVEFADPEKEFEAGEFVTVAFTTGEPKPALVVPESAVLLAADGSYVYAVNGTHLTRTRIKTGAISEGLVEVQDGLYAGDSVAMKGVQNIWLVELSAIKGGTPCCPVKKT
jgi:hypothetical protein